MSFLEAAVVIGLVDGREVVTYRHAPPRRSAVSLPDSTALWSQLWGTRETLVGVAHLHPGHGPEARRPSHEDLTTFRAVERGLGMLLIWWIATVDAADAYWYSLCRQSYDLIDTHQPHWLPELLQLGQGEDI